MKFFVIGVTDDTEPWFPPQVMDIIRQGHLFSGGIRHHALVAHLLPQEHTWIDITVPVDEVFKEYRRYAHSPEKEEISVVVFASGDPLFYGFATTIQRMEPEATMQVFPAPNSLQLLAHRLMLAYQDMRVVSLTGRPWQGLDEALIRGERLIGILADKTKTPRLIAQRMVDYGYTNYEMTVGECLGNPVRERIISSALQHMCERTEGQQPCCLILRQTSVRPHPFGIPDSEFHLLDGRRRMITKAPIRLLTLSALELPRRQCLWDVGFCTGSISIEARLQFPHLHVEAFEIRPEGEKLMTLNSRRHGVPGIEVHIGDFLEQDLSCLPRPDAVFIGGHGGKLPLIIERIRERLIPGGVIVFNSVSEESAQLFRQTVGNCEETGITLEGYHPIRIMKKRYE